MGLSGLGDLLLTCSSAQSRNFAYGLALGRGEDLAGLPLAEGVPSAGIAARIASEHGIDAPIIEAVSRDPRRPADDRRAVAACCRARCAPRPTERRRPLADRPPHAMQRRLRENAHALRHLSARTSPAACSCASTRARHVEFLNGLNAKGTLTSPARSSARTASRSAAWSSSRPTTRPRAKAIAADDPYAKAGLFARVEISPGTGPSTIRRRPLRRIGDAATGCSSPSPSSLVLGDAEGARARPARNGTACATTRRATTCARWRSATAASSTIPTRAWRSSASSRSASSPIQDTTTGGPALGMRRHPRRGATCPEAGHARRRSRPIRSSPRWCWSPIRGFRCSR